MTTEFVVSDATCGHCKQTIESTILAIEGVDAATLDIESKRLTVEHDGEVGQSVLTTAIEAAGYTPEATT